MKRITKIFLLPSMAAVLGIHFASAQVTGTSSNLCPGVNYTYNLDPSPSQTNCPNATAQQWACAGCDPASVDKNGFITTTGTNSDGTLWATVKWLDTATGSIGIAGCAYMNVSIIVNAQPTISGPTQLCGSGTATFTAGGNAANINKYLWTVSGSGFSPTNVVYYTTAPTTTLNYSSWAASSTYAPTVSVASVNSACNYTTPASSLTVRPGNLSSLKNFTFSFLPPGFCSATGMTISPSSSGINWGPPNSVSITYAALPASALSIQDLGLTSYPNNVFKSSLTRANNYNGPATVTATLTNLCGSNSESTSVWVGLPSAPGALSANVDNICVGQSINFTLASLSDPGSSSISWTSLTPTYLSADGQGIGASITGLKITASGSYAKFSGTASNGCGNATSIWYSNVLPKCTSGGGTRTAAIEYPEETFTTEKETIFDMYPNPASNGLTVALESTAKADLPVLWYELSGKQVRTDIIETGKSSKTFQIADLSVGFYIVRVIDQNGIKFKKIVISR